MNMTGGQKQPEGNNPNTLINNQLTLLRTNREATISDIVSLEKEKEVIQKVLPKVFYELAQSRELIEQKRNEMQVLDSAIAEIEASYGNFLYSPDFFRDQN